jgi:DNA-directed RNA polymerase specialized sigma24 family protein
MDVTIETVMALGALGIGAGVGLSVWTVARRTAATMRAVESRLTQLTAGIALLTDTTEGGLRDVAIEVGRLAPEAPAVRPRPRAASQRRIASAARRGRSVQEIAAIEDVSEGEVRLRLNLASQGLTNASVR